MRVEPITLWGHKGIRVTSDCDKNRDTCDFTAFWHFTHFIQGSKFVVIYFNEPPYGVYQRASELFAPVSGLEILEYFHLLDCAISVSKHSELDTLIDYYAGELYRPYPRSNRPRCLLWRKRPHTTNWKVITARFAGFPRKF